MNQIQKRTTTHIDNFLTQREQFINRIQPLLTPGVDFYEIKGKKSLGKPGAEKIASIFGWTATFSKDEDTLSMLGGKPGLVCFVCNLTNLNKPDLLVGQGRGASSLDKNYNDPNKTIKMAQKSSFIDAVIRTSGSSDIFTQDLEGMPLEQIGIIPPKPGARGVAEPVSVGAVFSEPTPDQLNDPDPGWVKDGDPADPKLLKEIVRQVELQGIDELSVKGYVISHFHKESIKDLRHGQAGQVLDWVLTRDGEAGK